VFPREVYQVQLGLVPATIALHHACATPPPCIRSGRMITSMDHKVEQLSRIRTYVANPLWRKLLFRLKELIRRNLLCVERIFRERFFRLPNGND
jgi:hypothetical protein